jgi:hypothetical protein
MKKLCTSIFLLALFGAVNSQQTNPLIPAEKATQSALKSKVMGTGLEVLPPTQESADKPANNATQKSIYTEWIVGNTYYDLQSNSSVMPRLSNLDGDMAGVFTMSSQPSGYTDRGTGYAVSTNEFWSESPTERIESIRTGWPSLLQLGDGSEVVISHDFPTQLVLLKRAQTGTGAWTESILTHNVPEGISWNRAVAGGSDGNTIHLIAITMPGANQTAEPPLTYQGLDGALLYSRSQDGGETWDIDNLVIPGIDSTFFIGFSADQYAIHARGNKVAIASFDDFADSFVLISEDNGDTWTKKTLVDFPVDLYTGDDFIIDLDEDLLADTLYNTDNSGAVFIDNDGITHVTWGNMYYLDDVLGDDQWSYFPFTDGLAYWNESMEENTWETIALSQDLDENEVLDIIDVGLYFMSLTSMPQIAEDASGNLYVSYSGIVESHSTGSQNFRHLHIVKSSDGGTSWTEPVDCTPDLDFIGLENVFASMSPVVDDYVHLLFQRDDEPGLAVRGDLDPPTFNDIVYFRITPDLVVEEVVGLEESTLAEVQIYPNPAGQYLVVDPGEYNVQFRLLDLKGKIVLEQAVRGRQSLDLSGLSAGFYIAQMQRGVAVQNIPITIRR